MKCAAEIRGHLAMLLRKSREDAENQRALFYSCLRLLCGTKAAVNQRDISTAGLPSCVH